MESLFLALVIGALSAFAAVLFYADRVTNAPDRAAGSVPSAKPLHNANAQSSAPHGQRKAA